MNKENNNQDSIPILHPDDFRASLNNLADLPDYLEKINQNIMNIEKRISKKEFNTEKVKEYARIHSLRNNNNSSQKNINEDEEIPEDIPGTDKSNDAFDLKNIVKASVEGINDIFKPKIDKGSIEPIKEETYLSGNDNIEPVPNNENSLIEKQKQKLKPIVNKKKPVSAKYPDNNSKKNKNFKLDLSNESNIQGPFKNKPYRRPAPKNNIMNNYSSNINSNSKIISHLQNYRYNANNEVKTSPNNNELDTSEINKYIDSVEPNPSNLKINKVTKNRGQSKSPLPNKGYQFKPKQKASTIGKKAPETNNKNDNYISPKKKRDTSLNKNIAQKSKDILKGSAGHSNINSNSNMKSPNLKNSLIERIDSVNSKILSTPETRNKPKVDNSYAGVSKKNIKSSVANAKDNKKVKPDVRQNISVSNNIYSKAFPKEANVDDIMKMMLFFNEYLMKNNSSKFTKEERINIITYSNFLCDKLINNNPITQTKEEITYEDKEKKCILIQRKWRKYKSKEFVKGSNINDEFKKMLISNFVEKEGFGIRKIIGMMNSSIDEFIKLKSKDIISEEIVNIYKGNLSSSKKDTLYKGYINYNLMKKKGGNVYNANNDNALNTLLTSKSEAIEDSAVKEEPKK